MIKLAETCERIAGTTKKLEKIAIVADYLREGDHRAALDPQQPFHLTLDTLNLDVRPQ